MNAGTPFFKLEGLANDFVLIDARRDRVPVSVEATAAWSDRRTGIGFDQLLVLHPHDSLIARVEIRNADGSSAEQCGNGMRAIAAWLDSRGELASDAAVDTPAGRVALRPAADGRFTAVLPGPRAIEPASLGLTLPTLAGLDIRTELVSMGNPHLVLLSLEEPTEEALAHVVDEIEHCDGWKNAANISLARAAEGRQIRLRVHERGAGPTQACGSAACAVAWVVAGPHTNSGPLQVMQPGGSLVVDFDASDDRVRSTGPARVVFEGRTA